MNDLWPLWLFSVVAAFALGFVACLVGQWWVSRPKPSRTLHLRNGVSISARRDPLVHVERTPYKLNPPDPWPHR